MWNNCSTQNSNKDLSQKNLQKNTHMNNKIGYPLAITAAMLAGLYIGSMAPSYQSPVGFSPVGSSTAPAEKMSNLLDLIGRQYVDTVNIA